MEAFVSARGRSREAGKPLRISRDVLRLLPGEHSAASILKVFRVVLEGQQAARLLAFDLGRNSEAQSGTCSIQGDTVHEWVGVSRSRIS